MDADWYEDPLGRYDGRFFDGERWTERVSADGALAVDPDFDVAPAPGAPDEMSESASDDPDRNDPIHGDQDRDGAVPSPPTRNDFDAGTEPAVAAVVDRSQRKASLIEESPVRTVAVLDERIVAPSNQAATKNNRRFVVWGLLGLIGLLLIAGLLLLANGGDDGVIADGADLDEQQEERLEDLAVGGTDSELDAEAIEELEVDAPVGVVDASEVFDSAELVEVGSLRIVNGASALSGLEDWHRGFAADRGVVLGQDSGCWFGQLGGAAVQVAQCGPVGGSADTEYLFDLVPLLFEDVDGGQIAQPVVDAVTIDSVLANALTLVGSADSSPPPESLEGATSGD